MSVFVQQQGTFCDFPGGDSWVILSPIEQSIKRKIEAVGTPLKDWDIQINYGIKTGFNDAFIITSEKRDEILANCATEDERKKTDELIRRVHHLSSHLFCSLYSEQSSGCCDSPLSVQAAILYFSIPAESCR